jgi:cobalamin biosynthesis Mg chelatase CobN
VAANASADAKVEIVLVGVTATHSSGVVYNPVPQIQKYIYVKPEGSKFMKMRVETETTVIEAGTSTQVTITVKDQDNEPVSGAVVAAIPTDVGPTVTEETTTDSQGVAYLTFNAPAKVQEDAAFMIEITVSHADFAEPIFTTETIQVLKVAEPKEEGSSLPITTIGIVVAVIVVVAVLAVVAKGMANKKKEKAKKADKPKTEGR